MERGEKDWRALRDNFLPKKLRVIFILESPPSGGKYFYDPEGNVSEILFRAMMKILGLSPKTKEEGLKAFRDEGFLMVNPIYEPVDKLPDKEADILILDNYQTFILELKDITKNDPLIPLILVKANICRILESKLMKDGFNVLNNGLIIPFPMHYHMPSFETKIKSLLK